MTESWTSIGEEIFKAKYAEPKHTRTPLIMDDLGEFRAFVVGLLGNKAVSNWEQVGKHSRARKHGTILLCPKCESTEGNRVYHFSWSALTCQNCRKMVNKEEWKMQR